MNNALLITQCTLLNAKKFVTNTFPLDKIVDAIDTTKSCSGLKTVIEI